MHKASVLMHLLQFADVDRTLMLAVANLELDLDLQWIRPRMHRAFVDGSESSLTDWQWMSESTAVCCNVQP